MHIYIHQFVRSTAFGARSLNFVRSTRYPLTVFNNGLINLPLALNTFKGVQLKINECVISVSFDITTKNLPSPMK